jgi:FMN-dependent NADH-azoreductase
MLVTRRDLSRCPPPYPDRTFVEASLMAEAERGARELAALSYSETLIAELEAADLIVIDTPMHNFTVPSVLKSWVDHVVRPGRTFRVTPQGKAGLLRDRPVFVMIACGGPFSGSPAGQTDFLTPYLNYVLATVGLHDVATLRLENLRRGTAAIEQAEAHVAAWIMEQAANWLKRQSGGL